MNTLVKIGCKRISNVCFSSPINLQNGRQKILDLLEIADFSQGIEFVFKAVIGQYNLRTIFLHSHWRK